MTDREQLCREFTELTGGKLHYKVGNYYCHCGASIWDTRHLEDHIKIETRVYTNPAEIIFKMQQREDWCLFADKIRTYTPLNTLVSIPIDYILEPDALLKAAVEFLKEGK